MRVIQRVGRYAGTVIDLPYLQARAALDNGTAAPEYVDEAAQAPESVSPATDDAPSAYPPFQPIRRRGRPRKNP